MYPRHGGVTTPDFDLISQRNNGQEGSDQSLATCRLLRVRPSGLPQRGDIGSILQDVRPHLLPESQAEVDRVLRSSGSYNDRDTVESFLRILMRAARDPLVQILLDRRRRALIQRTWHRPNWNTLSEDQRQECVFCLPEDSLVQVAVLLSGLGSSVIAAFENFAWPVLCVLGWSLEPGQRFVAPGPAPEDVKDCRQDA